MAHSLPDLFLPQTSAAFCTWFCPAVSYGFHPMPLCRKKPGFHSAHPSNYGLLFLPSTFTLGFNSWRSAATVSALLFPSCAASTKKFDCKSPFATTASSIIKVWPIPWRIRFFKTSDAQQSEPSITRRALLTDSWPCVPQRIICRELRLSLFWS